MDCRLRRETSLQGTYPATPWVARWVSLVADRTTDGITQGTTRQFTLRMAGQVLKVEMSFPQVTSKPKLQKFVQLGRKLVPRGWAPLLKKTACLSATLQNYRAKIGGDDFLHLDLRESMCLIYFFHDGLPHERGTETLLRYVLKPGDTVIDVGANVGYYTRMASLLVGDAGRVLAFEPMPTALRLLRNNTTDLPNVTVEDKALSDHEGKEEFYVRDHGDTSSLVRDQISFSVRVSVTTLDRKLSLASLERVDFIKIDVEGSELDVLRGSVETIKRYQPIVYFELLPTYAKQYGFEYSDFISFFAKFRYTLRWINHKGNGPDLVSKGISNYVVAVPRDRLASVSNFISN